MLVALNLAIQTMQNLSDFVAILVFLLVVTSFKWSRVKAMVWQVN